MHSHTACLITWLHVVQACQSFMVLCKWMVVCLQASMVVSCWASDQWMAWLSMTGITQSWFVALRSSPNTWVSCCSPLFFCSEFWGDFLVCLDLYLQIFWSDSGELVCIATEESFFILRYLSEKVAASQESNEGVTEDGIEDAFEVSVKNTQSCLTCWKEFFQRKSIVIKSYKHI